MVTVHGHAQKDESYAIGARFGWWGVKRPDRTEGGMINCFHSSGTRTVTPH
jgi:hypothetical protein